MNTGLNPHPKKLALLYLAFVCLSAAAIECLAADITDQQVEALVRLTNRRVASDLSQREYRNLAVGILGQSFVSKEVLTKAINIREPALVKGGVALLEKLHGELVEAERRKVLKETIDNLAHEARHRANVAHSNLVDLRHATSQDPNNADKIQQLQLAASKVEEANKDVLATHRVSKSGGDNVGATDLQEKLVANAFANAEAFQNSWGNVYFWGGAQLASPYKILKEDGSNGKRGAIVGGNSEIQGFINANVNLRYVLRGNKREWPLGRVSGNAVDDSECHTESILGAFGHKIGWVVPDIDIGISYLFQGDQSETLTAATVASTADVGGNVDIGLPLVRWHGPHSQNEPQDAIQQLTLETGLSLATDKRDLQIQNALFLGLGYQGGFTTGLLKRFIWISKLGYTWGETPEVDPDTGLVQFNVRDQIQYVSDGAITATARFIFELTQSTALQAGAAVFFYREVPTWSLSIGFSFDPAKALSRK